MKSNLLILKHALFNNQTIQNDIAVLQLIRPVQLNSYIQTACLPKPSPSFPPFNSDAYVSGWVY